MHVQVRNDFPPMLPFIHDKPIPMHQPLFTCDAVCDADHVTQNCSVMLRDISHTLVVRNRYDEQVHRCVRIDIANNDHLIVPIDEVPRYLASDNLAKYVVAH